MSLKSKIYIAVIIFSILVIVGVRGYRYVEDLRKKNDYSRPAEEDNFSPFGIEGKEDEPSPARPDRLINFEGQGDIAPEQEQEQDDPSLKKMVKPVYNPDVFMLPSEAQLDTTENVEARIAAEMAAAAQKNADKYLANPSLQSFTKDMQAVIGQNVTPDKIFDKDFGAKYLNDPQMQKILLQYSKDPAFMKLMQDMMSDKEFIRTFEQNLNNTAPNAVVK